MVSVQSHAKTLLSLLCLVGITALTGCAPKSNHFGVILISNSVVGPADVYQISDNNQNKVERLTFTPTIGEYYFLVSKIGDKVVFETGFTELAEDPSDLAIEKRNHIYLLDTTSKELKDMTDIFTLPPTTSPMRVVDWSPDQKQFAVITYEGGLQFVDTDGTNRRDITIPSLGEIRPYIVNAKWSPDGKKIAVTRGDYKQETQYPGTALLVYDLESRKIVQLANNLEHCGLPIWSPNSKQIAATCTFDKEELGGPTVIRIFSAEHPGQPYEHGLYSPCQHPSWSPDGRQLAFDCKKGANQWGLYIINSDGNGIHEVKPENLESSVSLVEPTWSPDGTQIIYMALTNDGHSIIYVVNPDGSNNRALTDQDAFYSIVAVYPVP